jgi:hypothetical protein
MLYREGAEIAETKAILPHARPAVKNYVDNKSYVSQPVSSVNAAAELVCFRLEKQRTRIKC